jgi:hypothetical protein
MWFDRNGWMIVTPIALVLVVGAGVLRSSYTPQNMDASLATSERVTDWRDGDATRGTPAYGRGKSETTGSSVRTVGR